MVQGKAGIRVTTIVKLVNRLRKRAARVLNDKRLKVFQMSELHGVVEVSGQLIDVIPDESFFHPATYEGLEDYLFATIARDLKWTDEWNPSCRVHCFGVYDYDLDHGIVIFGRASI